MTIFSHLKLKLIEPSIIISIKLPLFAFKGIV